MSNIESKEFNSENARQKDVLMFFMSFYSHLYPCKLLKQRNKYILQINFITLKKEEYIKERERIYRGLDFLIKKFLPEQKARSLSIGTDNQLLSFWIEKY